MKGNIEEGGLVLCQAEQIPVEEDNNWPRRNYTIQACDKQAVLDQFCRQTTSQHFKKVSLHVLKKNSATGETSQAIASLTNFTSFAFMTRLLSSQITLSLDNFYHQITFTTR